MNVGELKELLENFEDDEAMVLIGIQPSWPLCHGVAGVTSFGEREVECPDHKGYLLEHDKECMARFEADNNAEEPSSDQRAVWVVASEGHPYDRSPYAPRWLWEEGGWR